MYNVLICDDQPDIVSALRIYLTPEGYRLFEASNGKQALELVRGGGMDLVLLDVTPASHGNGIGVGLFDVITRKVADQLDLEAMYANAIACNCLIDASVPCTVDDAETAVRVALKCCRNIDRDDPKSIRIKNTLPLGEIEVSEALLGEVAKDPRMSLIQK